MLLPFPARFLLLQLQLHQLSHSGGESRIEAAGVQIGDPASRASSGSFVPTPPCSLVVISFCGVH
jgi:hypothetical protein